MTQTLQHDQLTKYIRVTGDRHAKFVEFDFAIHDPTLLSNSFSLSKPFNIFAKLIML